jgi:mono/diheme cytochrome c family protein
MSRLVAAVLALLLSSLPAASQQPATPPAAPASPAPPTTPQPFAPHWAMLAGAKVFADKGCGGCHAVRGVGPKVGPDLGRIESARSFFDLAAAMWNHLPRMGARMREAGVERARMTADEVSNLLAFLYTAQYFDESGDARRGEALFTAKSCARCHAVGGKGGFVGPELDRLKKMNSPVLVAAAMWNHGPQMNRALKAAGIERPTFQGRELVDIIAYIVSAARDVGGDTQQVVPGTPDRGRLLLVEKKCAACHSVGGKGGRVGPPLDQPGHHISITEFAARLWNHAPAMEARMVERRITMPTLSGQDFADILAYLYVSRYFDVAPSVQRGRDLVQGKGCLSCHAVAGKGATVGGDFARSSVVRTPATLVAGMWNHSRLMEMQAEKRNVAWPELSGQDLADVGAYLRSLSRPSGKPTGK